MPKPDEEAARSRGEKPSVPAGSAAAPGPANPLHDGEDWDEVDEAAWESFPASDPPSRWAGCDEPEEKAEER